METISTYFNAERAESLLFLAVAMIALAGSAWCLLVRRKPFFNGMALSLSVAAALQLVVGVTIYQRSPQDAARVQRMVRSAPEQLQSEEVPRMRVVMRNFKVYLAAEITLLVLSLLLLRFAAPDGVARGAAMGLTVQATFTAALDLLATRRGAAYLSWLLTQA